jgi:hypothetical protein
VADGVKSREERFRNVLTRMLRMLKEAERCNICIPPAMGLNECHLEKWEKLLDEAQKLLAESPN